MVVFHLSRSIDLITMDEVKSKQTRKVGKSMRLNVVQTSSVHNVNTMNRCAHDMKMG